MAYPTSQILDAKVDDVTDVLAIHVNELQTAAVQMDLRYIKNTSGSTVAANDMGYIDEAGEFKLTTTAYLEANWAVVIVGGANNADIVVAVGGSKIVVILNGNCSIGDFLYTSTTTKQAQPQSYMRPEMFAIATTANSSGAGGTCEAVLYCNTKPIDATGSVNMQNIQSCADSDFTSTIATLPGGAVLTYGAVTTGNENTIDPVATDHLGKIRLYNSTRSTYGLIDTTVVGTNTITLIANVDAGWQVGDTITTRSPTTIYSAPPPYFQEIDLSAADNTVVPILARAIDIEVSFRDSAATGERAILHPWETYAASKTKTIPNYTVNIFTVIARNVPLIQRRFCVLFSASGAATGSIVLRVNGWRLAAP